MSNFFSIPGLSDARVALLEAKVRATGTPLAKLIENQGHRGLANDAAFQALQRLMERDEIPQQVVDEAAAWAAKEESDRLANAPIPAGR